MHYYSSTPYFTVGRPLLLSRTSIKWAMPQKYNACIVRTVIRTHAWPYHASVHLLDRITCIYDVLLGCYHRCRVAWLVMISLHIFNFLPHKSIARTPACVEPASRYASLRCRDRRISIHTLHTYCYMHVPMDRWTSSWVKRKNRTVQQHSVCVCLRGRGYRARSDQRLDHTCWFCNVSDDDRYTLLFWCVLLFFSF
jgi:hypothetical protein